MNDYNHADYRLISLNETEFAARLSEALRVYATAMGYPIEAGKTRYAMWRNHVNNPGWLCFAAVNSRNELLGICYGYQGVPGQWWHEQILSGLINCGGQNIAQEWLAHYFELTELHVLPEAQGRGIGEALLKKLLRSTTLPKVLLTTPEIHREKHNSPEQRQPNRAWRLYRRMGFVDVLRWYHFVGDFRPFAVLGRELPL